MTPLGSIGMIICFDVEFPEIARTLKLMKAGFMVTVNINMHPYELHHHLFSRCRAMENEIPVIICNRLGTEGEFDFCGDSMVIDATEEILLSLKDKEQVKTVSLPIKQELDPMRSYTANRRADMYDILTK
ncbi:carbon-nitrogen hydrolase family protein [Siminovitchia terrae]|uniref:carbon-nitrogen hydrolase family protein n=1 Tax=Siminovitchia terrae TaxID=1914933 RepID=UPI0024821452|nr:carbon-nitrogen hydrolase family protein [Siminovitchia terrae]